MEQRKLSNGQEVEITLNLTEEDQKKRDPH